MKNKNIADIYKVQGPLRLTDRVDGRGEINLITPFAMFPWEAFVWAMKERFGNTVFFLDEIGEMATSKDEFVSIAIEMSDLMGDEDDEFDACYVVLAEVRDWLSLIHEIPEDQLMKLAGAPTLPIVWDDAKGSV